MVKQQLTLALYLEGVNLVVTCKVLIVITTIFVESGVFYCPVAITAAKFINYNYNHLYTCSSCRKEVSMTHPLLLVNIDYIIDKWIFLISLEF